MVAPLLASAALALLNGCRSPEMQRCVDSTNRVVDPGLCNSNGSGTGTGTGARPYHFIYGGGGDYAHGSVVTGGSATPVSGHAYSTSTGTVRGGFGGSFGGGEGGGGEGGGHGGGGGGE